MSEQPANIDSEQFLTLLTQALRSGPASPEWHQAVGLLRSPNGDVDEHKLLYTAREHLESGKSYRSVRAGPGFGRQVMAQIDREPASRKRPTMAGIIVLLSGVTALVIAAIVLVIYLRSSNPRKQIDELTGQYFVHPVQNAPFENGIPEGWQAVGALPVIVKDKELRPAPQPASQEIKAGGLVCTTPLPADGAYQIIVVFRNPPTAEDSGAAQLFISDEPITPEHPTGSHELVCNLQGGQARVVLPGSDGPLKDAGDHYAKSPAVTVRIELNRELAVIDSRGNRLYAGPNGLDHDKPRYVGVRFRRRAGEKSDHVGAASIVVQKP